MDPQISVILSTHNDEKTIKESVKSILNQTYKNFDLIIINDASTDETTSILRQIKDRRIKIFTNKQKQGLTKSLNIGFKKAKGKFIARMDGDDIAYPQKLKTQLEYFEKNPEIVLCGTWAQLIDNQSRKIRTKKLPITPKEIKSKILRFNPFIHSSIMFRKSLLKSIGFYNPNFEFAQDYEFILRVAPQFPIANIPKILHQYRVLDSKSISAQNLKAQEKFALDARFLALKKFAYPKWQALYLLKPLFSYLIPSKIKLFLYQKLYWRTQ